MAPVAGREMAVKRAACKPQLAPTKAPPDGYSSRERALLALQRSAGNAATAAFLGRDHPRSHRQPAPPPVQRAVSERGMHTGGAHKSVKKFDSGKESLITAVDTATTQAYGQVVQRPMFTGLDVLVNKDGHVRLWVNTWNYAVKTNTPYPSPAADFGYAVESLTTHILGAAAAGWALSYQIASGTTRPDIVATKGIETMWLDLTAGSAVSSAHIYKSKQWHLPAICAHPHAEITYPPLDVGTLALMVTNAKAEYANKPKPATISVKKLSKNIKGANKLEQRRLADWNNRFSGGIKKNKTTRGFKGHPEADKLARKGLLKHLNATFSLTLSNKKIDDLRAAAGLLALLKISGRSFGLHPYSASAAAGRAFLVKHDKHMLTS